jgi:hypothetical protein
MRYLREFFGDPFVKSLLGAFFGLWASVVVITSGYQCRLVDDEIKRAWMVRLPGYRNYLDHRADPPVVRRYFTIFAYYRVGPWIKPEWEE